MGVITKMSKKKRQKKVTFTYVPSGTIYTPKQIAEYEAKEEQLIKYIMEHFLFTEKASVN
jgi:hypothetical protein